MLAFLAAFAVGSSSGAQSGSDPDRDACPPRRAKPTAPASAPAIRHARPGASKIVHRHRAWQAEDHLFN